MGAFKIELVGVGGHGCERKAKAGDKLHGRCGRFTCPDCIAFDFTQRLRQAGMVREGDQAYSVPIDAIAIGEMKEKGLLVGLERGSDPERQQTYLGTVITDARFVPTGAMNVIAYKEQGSNEVKAYAQFPHKAEFTHWPGDDKSRVVDDMLANERRSGSF